MQLTERERTILLVGGLAVAGIAIVSISKGINQAEGNIGQGIANGVQNVFSSVASDVLYVGVGAGIFGISLFLPPPLDVIGFVAALAAPVLLYETSNANAPAPASTNGN